MVSRLQALRIKYDELAGTLGSAGFAISVFLATLFLLGIDPGAIIKGEQQAPRFEAIESRLATVESDTAQNRNAGRDIRTLLTAQAQEDQRLAERLDGQASHGAAQDKRLDDLERETTRLGYRQEVMERDASQTTNELKDIGRTLLLMREEQAATRQNLANQQQILVTIQDRLDRFLGYRMPQDGTWHDPLAIPVANPAR